MFSCTLKKKGRPLKFGYNTSYLTQKKELLFGESSNGKYMNLVNIAYHSNKITKDEYEIAIFLEQLYHNMKKDMEVKSIPKSSPISWTGPVKRKMQYIEQSKDKSLLEWNRIKLIVQKTEPKIASEFLNLICSHHTYEELLSLKFNFQIMDILKKGLSCILQYT